MPNYRTGYYTFETNYYKDKINSVDLIWNPINELPVLLKRVLPFEIEKLSAYYKLNQVEQRQLNTIKKVIKKQLMQKSLITLDNILGLK